MSNMIIEDNNLEKNYSKDDSPLVSILMAVYKPNKKWIVEQLDSLNEQTYENIELLVYDDCPEFPISEELIGKYITNFSYVVVSGTKNEGSNKAFEELTKIANGEFFAYCDQDDIWEKEKITLMIDKFYEKDVTLVCSDLSIIDENGQKIAKSITEIRKRIIYKSGYNLAKELLMTNFVTGCAMIVKRDISMKAIPFEKTLVHDQWIAIIAALNGKIEFINRPLVRYRQHSSNQTGILKDVHDKKTYYSKRIEDFIYRYKSLEKRLKYAELEEHIKSCLIWLDSRKKYFFKPNIKNLKVMIKYRDFHKVSIIIEIVLPFLPECIFKYIIKMAKKGVL
ncbi:glycosyltransferase involved in cell wall biosynthesis [Clostridium saccharoperbutylacetonicum]|uniref:Glycosyltransferase n=2 Tax=Clostridium saccharoperbutylacetonicum TaxID=36745 RepID=M1MSQ9_9CLOT|nr:glycosyltransferase [Clostridium saccharoperbutylacetonicum N1-4(HMT)]NRT60040.1 glycosyltransferase involved in cell wall biosynthesis [Clostridium saccharoperbutylacetonicum]NSB23352.1 glycosyltransferase involved in cell wall biosynthesis [Clostridium saccharoperbutylacetonicum]NSB42722.1 glycosyltransferase involved in cell wall biosynthesis [Clostridium saccharoperbutylacetonicum]